MKKKVILGCDFEKYRPQVIAIKYVHWVRGSITDVHKDWENILFQNNFSFVYKNFWDRFYVDNRISGQKEKFLNVDDYLRRFFGKLILINIFNIKFIKVTRILLLISFLNYFYQYQK